VSVRLKLPVGALEGTHEFGVQVFRGIPYAPGAVGERRFRAPGPAPHWSGVRDARRPGAAAHQRTAAGLRIRRWSAVPAAGASEDCLHLNVFAPTGRATRRPVMVWIHGGGYNHGSGSWYVYGGHRLVRRGDVVVVTINYRLGALGALDLRAFGGAATDTNVGLRDQIAALSWVRENIEIFGGDPENVTVFGQSAGAMSIGVLLTSPLARGLFARAILESGAMRNVLGAEEARGVTAALLDALCIDPESPHVIDRLRGLDPGEILRAQARVSARHRLPLGMLAWQPVVDDDVVPVLPTNADTPSTLPILVGTNLEEWKLFTATDAKRRSLDGVTLRGYVERTLARDGVASPGVVDELLEVYGRCPESGGRRSPADVWVALQTDRVFRLPAVDLVERHARSGGAGWLYRFDWAPRIAPRRIGACHAIEIPFVFGTLREPTLRPWIGMRPSSLRLSDTMQATWLAFARSGDPCHAALSEWPAFDPGRGEAHVFAGAGDPSHPRRPALEEDIRALWRRLSAMRRPDARAAPA